MEEAEADAAAKEQAAREDKYERLLMDVYNALYKVGAGWAHSVTALRALGP